MEDTEILLSEGTLEVKLCGDIDHHLASSARNKIDKEIAKIRPQKFILNLENVEFMDSSGLGLILGRFRFCKEHNCKFAIKNPPKSVMRILRVAGMEKMFLYERCD